MAASTDRSASSTSAVFLTDGTADANRAASIATALVPTMSWRVAALIGPHPSLLTGETGFASAIQSPDEMEDEAARRRHAGADAAAHTASSFRQPVRETVVLSGSDATPLVDYARAEHLDLIVAPTPVGLADRLGERSEIAHGDTGDTGDLTRDLLTSSIMPLLAVPSSAEVPPPGEVGQTTVLIAVDDSRLDAAVVRTVEHLFGHDDVRYVVAHVDPSTAAIQSIPVSAGLFFANGDDALPNIAERLDDNATQAELVAARVVDDADLDGALAVGEVGDPVAGILSLATDHAADVIVVGTRNRSWFSRLFEPSVARAMAARALCPILVVPSEPTSNQP